MTIAGDPPITASAPPSTPKKNVFERFAGALFSPGETFEEIARRPDILAPMVVILVISILCVVAIVPRMDFTQSIQEQMAQQGREIDEQGMKFAVAFSKSAAYVSPLIGIVLYLVVAGVLLIAFRLFGGEGDFRQALSATLYAYVPMTLKGILMTIVGLSRDSIDPTTYGTTLVRSNAAFLVDMKAHPVLFSLLASLDAFTIWSVVLFIIAFAAVAKVSRATSASIVLSLWLAWLVMKVGAAAFFSSIGKKA
jgi:hypothetical protein